MPWSQWQPGYKYTKSVTATEGLVRAFFDVSNATVKYSSDTSTSITTLAQQSLDAVGPNMPAWQHGGVSPETYIHLDASRYPGVAAGPGAAFPVTDIPTAVIRAERYAAVNPSAAEIPVKLINTLQIGRDYGQDPSTGAYIQYQSPTPTGVTWSGGSYPTVVVWNIYPDPPGDSPAIFNLPSGLSITVDIDFLLLNSMPVEGTSSDFNGNVVDTMHVVANGVTASTAFGTAIQKTSFTSFTMPEHSGSSLMIGKVARPVRSGTLTSDLAPNFTDGVGYSFGIYAFAEGSVSLTFSATTAPWRYWIPEKNALSGSMGDDVYVVGGVGRYDHPDPDGRTGYGGTSSSAYVRRRTSNGWQDLNSAQLTSLVEDYVYYHNFNPAYLYKPYGSAGYPYYEGTHYAWYISDLIDWNGTVLAIVVPRYGSSGHFGGMLLKYNGSSWSIATHAAMTAQDNTHFGPPVTTTDSFADEWLGFAPYNGNLYIYGAAEVSGNHNFRPGRGEGGLGIWIVNTDYTVRFVVADGDNADYVSALDYQSPLTPTATAFDPANPSRLFVMGYGRTGGWYDFADQTFHGSVTTDANRPDSSPTFAVGFDGSGDAWMAGGYFSRADPSRQRGHDFFTYSTDHGATFGGTSIASIGTMAGLPEVHEFVVWQNELIGVGCGPYPPDRSDADVIGQLVKRTAATPQPGRADLAFTLMLFTGVEGSFGSGTDGVGFLSARQDRFTDGLVIATGGDQYYYYDDEANTNVPGPYLFTASNRLIDLRQSLDWGASCYLVRGPLYSIVDNGPDQTGTAKTVALPLRGQGAATNQVASVAFRGVSR